MAVNTLTNGNALDGSFAHFPPDSPVGIVPFWGSHEFASHTEFTVLDDAILLCKFPAGTYMMTRGVEDFAITAPDMDSDGTPAITFDVGIGDSDGEIDTELIGDSAAGQAGGDDLLDAANDVHFLDVGDKYLILKLVIPADTDAFVGETFEFSGFITRNLVYAQKQPVSH